MAYQDLVGLLTGTPTQPIQPVTRNQRLAQGAAGGGRAVGKMFGKLIGKEVPDNPMEQLEKLLPNMSPDNPDDLAQLAKLQLASGNSVGAARTLAQRQAILNEEKADTRYAETQKTSKGIRDEARDRYETGLEIAEDAREESRKRFEIQEERLSTSQGKLLKDDKERIFDAEEKAVSASGMARNTLSLAERYAREKPRGGFIANAYEGLKGFVGGQDSISSLKTDLTRVINSSLIDGLPPGVASDKDIELLQRGFPNSSWSRQEIEQWLRASAKMSALSATKNIAKSKYLNSNNGNLSGFTEQWQKTLKSEGFTDNLYKEYGLGTVTNASDEPRTQEFDQDFANSLKTEGNTSVADPRLSAPIIGTL